MGVTCIHYREVWALVATQQMLGLVAKAMNYQSNFKNKNTNLNIDMPDMPTGVK